MISKVIANELKFDAFLLTRPHKHNIHSQMFVTLQFLINRSAPIQRYLDLKQ